METTSETKTTEAAPAVTETSAETPAVEAKTDDKATPAADPKAAEAQAAEAVAEATKKAEADAAIAAKEAKRKQLRELADRKTERFQAGEQTRAEKERQRSVVVDQTSEIEKLRQRAAVADSFEKAAGDPAELLRLLRSHKVSAEHIARALFEEGTPEYQAQLRQKQHQDLEKTIEERVEAKLQKHVQDLETQRLEQGKMYAFRSFAGGVMATKDDSGAEAYPALAYMLDTDAEQVRKRLDQVVTRAIAGGLSYDDSDYADFLESEFKPKYNKTRERFLSGPGTSQSKTGTAQSKSVASGNGATRAPAVTNSVTSGSALPANFDDLSDAEQDKILLQRLNASQR